MSLSTEQKIAAQFTKIAKLSNQNIINTPIF